MAAFLRRDRNLERRRPSIPRPGLLRTHENGGGRQNAINRKEADAMMLVKKLKKRRTELNTTKPTEVKDAKENSLFYFNTMLIKLCKFAFVPLITYTCHCWKILLILVLGKVESKTQYSHFVICKVWVLGFTHHFTLHPLIWQIFSLISWLYFSTMWILWGRKCDYWVFHITHAKKGLPNHSSSTRDLKDFFSICDVENTILTYPPHSILSVFYI